MLENSTTVSETWPQYLNRKASESRQWWWIGAGGFGGLGVGGWMLRAWDPKVESFWRTRSRRAELCQVRWWSLHPEGGGPLRPEHWRVFTEGAESVHQLHSKWVEVVLALCRKWASIVAAVDFEVWEFIINWCHPFLHTLHGYFVSSHKCDFPENELLS